MSSKRAFAPPGAPSVSKKPCLQYAHSCLNPHCGMSFATAVGRNIHMGKAPECLLALVACKTKTQSIGQ
jgi:hypothetical protein